MSRGRPPSPSGGWRQPVKFSANRIFDFALCGRCEHERGRADHLGECGCRSSAANSTTAPSNVAATVMTRSTPSPDVQCSRKSGASVPSGRRPIRSATLTKVTKTKLAHGDASWLRPVDANSGFCALKSSFLRIDSAAVASRNRRSGRALRMAKPARADWMSLSVRCDVVDDVVVGWGAVQS